MNKPSDDTKTGLEPIAERVPIERKIDLRFPTFEGMVTGVSSNLSTSGMFIQSNNPEGAGTEFAFALRIDEWSPIQGSAKVIWVRSHTEGPERPAGMGVQFLDLDAQSRRMIRWLVDKHLQEGGKLFDLDTVPSGASKFDARAAKRQRKPRGRTRRRGQSSALGNRWLLLVLTVLVVAAAAGFAYLQWFDEQPGVGPLRPPRSADVQGSTASPAVEAESAPDQVGDPEDAPVVTVTINQVAGFVDSWTKAWEARDADGVIAHYADDFDATAAGGRQQWESDVRRLIASSEHIRVAVSALEVSFPTADTARAIFFRSLRSAGRDQSGRMALDLERTESGWKIRREQQLD